jgi:alpha-beta hydrolase superfamily lysophospholipase
VLQFWTPENENRIQKIFPILVTCGAGDPVGGMRTTVRALIERYQQYGVKDVSHVFYEGARHEPVNAFCRDQIHADVLAWLDARLLQDQTR